MVKVSVVIVLCLALLQTCDATKTLTSPESLQEALRIPSKHFVVLFLSPEEWCVQCALLDGVYAEVAEMFRRDRGVAFYRLVTDDQELLTRYTTGVPFVRLFPKTDRETGEPFSGTVDATELFDFVQKRVLSAVALPDGMIFPSENTGKGPKLVPARNQLVDVTEATLAQHTRGPAPFLMEVYVPQRCEKCVALAPKWASVAAATPYSPISQ